MSDHPPDLSPIARQQRQLRDQMGLMRDDVAGMAAITQRLDRTAGGFVDEVRAMHSQHWRLANRVTAFEASEQP